MKENYIEKINRMGKIGHSFAKICTVILNIAVVACIVAAVMLAFVPKDSIMVTTSHRTQVEVDKANNSSLVVFELDDDGTVEIDGIIYDDITVNDTLEKTTTTAKTTPYTYSIHDMLWVMAAGAVMSIVFVLVFRNITKLCKKFSQCDTPFTLEIADDIRKLAFSFIPVMLMASVMDAVVKRITTGVWDIVIGIDLTVVMIMVVVLMMAEIFRYGTMLQTESDETL